VTTTTGTEPLERIVSTCFARYFLKVGTRLAAMGSDDMP